MNPKEIVEKYEKSNVVKPENRNNEKQMVIKVVLVDAFVTFHFQRSDRLQGITYYKVTRCITFYLKSCLAHCCAIFLWCLGGTQKNTKFIEFPYLVTHRIFH